jgi:hypothetical protein
MKINSPAKKIAESMTGKTCALAIFAPIKNVKK